MPSVCNLDKAAAGRKRLIKPMSFLQPIITWRGCDIWRQSIA
jgi:hypothetical protein